MVETCTLYRAACQPVLTVCVGAGKGDEVYPRHRQCLGLGRTPFLLGLGRSRRTPGMYLCAWRPAGTSVRWKGWSARHTVSLLRLEYLGFSSGVNCVLIPKERERKDERKEKERRKGGWVEGGKEGNSIHMKKMVNKTAPIHLVVIMVTSVSSAVKM